MQPRHGAVHRARASRRRLWAVVIALLWAALACSLDTSAPDSGGNARPATRLPASSGSTTTPAVSILEPGSGQAVPPAQPVDIRVATDSTTTSFVLNVNGRVASSRSLPEGQSGPAEAILTWNVPNQSGTYTLEVIAFNGSRASDPAALTLDVRPGAASAASGTVAGACTGKVLVSQLNFRDGPATTGTRLGQFDVGETVAVIARNQDGTWFQVQRPANSQQGWVINNLQWFQTEGQCTNLPVAGG